MRGFRSLIILVLIAIPVGWFTYRESQRAPGDDEPAKEKVFTVEADSIEEITITSEGGDKTQLKKAGDKGWEIVSPVSASPDSSAVSGITSNLSSLEIQRVVDENPADLKEYGLAEPRIQVAFKSGGQDHTLLIGEKTPPGTDLYAKRAADNRVFLIPSYLESTFNKGTFDLRDKSVLKVDRDKLDTIEIASAGKTLRFTKPSGGEWQIADPLQARADSSAVESLVSRLTSLQMKAIVNPDEPRKTGLEKPAATVKLGTGSSQATLLVGAAAEEDTVYARDQSRPLVFTIESSLMDELKKGVDDFRQKDLFDARSFNTTRLEIVRSGQTYSFEKTKTKNQEGQEEEKWRQLSPETRDLDESAFNSLLSATTGARATEFVDTPAARKALASPELSITIKFDEGKKEERVTLAKSGSDAFASRAGEPGAARLEASTVDSIVKALQELK